MMKHTTEVNNVSPKNSNVAGISSVLISKEPCHEISPGITLDLVSLRSQCWKMSANKCGMLILNLDYPVLNVLAVLG